MDTIVLGLVIVLCYVVSTTILNQKKNRKGSALIENLTKLLLWLIMLGK